MEVPGSRDRISLSRIFIFEKAPDFVCSAYAVVLINALRQKYDG